MVQRMPSSLPFVRLERALRSSSGDDPSHKICCLWALQLNRSNGIISFAALLTDRY